MQVISSLPGSIRIVEGRPQRSRYTRDNAAAARFWTQCFVRVHEEVPFPGYGVATDFIPLRFVMVEHMVPE